DGNNALYGGAGDDYLVGLGGADLFYGEAGVDFMAGGLGADIYHVDNPFDIVLENAGEGYDEVYTSSSIGLREGVEVERIGTENYLATAAIYITGNEFGQEIIANNGNNALSGMGGNDYLVGLDGADQLDGGTGIDVAVGGAGNDIFRVDNMGDVVREDEGEGLDEVYASASYTLPAGAHIELLGTADYLSTAAIDLGGNELRNRIAGNNGANVLRGFDGEDDLNGLEGDDVLDGGAGRDGLMGGEGADIFRFGSVSDSVAGHEADSIYDFVSGEDRIDLLGIDANALTGGDDAFTFIGGDAFSGKAGELRWGFEDHQMSLYGDVNGDGAADFQVVIVGSSWSFVPGDFML
ncbi:MAG TPA: calcium-binding protein, partial [Allosphingosinicella sp.]